MKILTLQEEIAARIERKANFLKACAKADEKIDAVPELSVAEARRIRKKNAWRKMMKDPKKRAANAARQREKRKLMKGKTNVKKTRGSVNGSVTHGLSNFLDNTCNNT